MYLPLLFISSLWDIKKKKPTHYSRRVGASESLVLWLPYMYASVWVGGYSSSISGEYTVAARTWLVFQIPHPK